jgi:cation transport ATPase
MTLIENENTTHSEEHAIFSIPLSIPAGIAESELRTLEGVDEVSINHLKHTVHVTYDPTKTSSDKIHALLKKLGS